MKRTIYTLLTLLTITTGSATAQDFSWAKSMGGFGVDRSTAVVVDQQGNVYTAGTFGSSGDFDPGPGVVTFSAAGNYDIFIQKLDPAGNLLWVKQIGGIMDDVPSGMAIDASGNIYVTGYFSDQVDFDPGAGTTQLITAGNYDAFVLKMDTNGNLAWAHRIGSTLGEFANDVAIDQSGNVFITGLFGGTVDFDPGAGTANLTSTDNNFYESFLLKLTNSGTFSWVKQLGGAEDEYCRALSTDPTGNIYTTGYFYGTVDFDPGAGTDSHTSEGGSDVFIQKLTPAGDFVWTKTIGSTGNEYCTGVDAAVSGAVYLYGTFNDTVDFDPGAGITSFPTIGQADAFVLKLNDSGTFVWARQIGSPNQDFARGIVTDASGNVYLAGNIYETTDLDPGAGTAIFSPAAQGQGAVYAEKLDASGNYQWAGVIAPNNDSYATGIALGPQDDVHVVGSYAGTADFDPGTGVTQFSSIGNHDAFVVKLGGGVAGIATSELPVLKVWPNPTSGEITIDLGMMNDKLDVTVMDLSGKQISSERFHDTAAVKINLKGDPGIYFVKVGEQLLKVIKN
jgi:hypothetical protein